MKRAATLSTFLLAGTLAFSQQIPLSESYFMERYTLAPSYAGNDNAKYLFTGYRSDWSGIPGGPKTVRLSYSDALMQNAGYGGRIVYDKTGIFSQLYVMGSYSYRLEFIDSHFLLFGMSAGFYRNGINLTDYYNDPNYDLDPALTGADIRSKLKFMSDVSMVYRWEALEAGFLFTNITFGEANYNEVETRYKPLANFQFHAAYRYDIDETWSLSPLVIVRSGKYIKSQFEIATQVSYTERFRGSVVFRDPGIFGFGAGLDIDKGLKLGYNFNFATNVQLNAFNSHEVTLGINIFEYIGTR
jgi:type IX secretion system PorP/SprF family membrane protein